MPLPSVLPSVLPGGVTPTIEQQPTLNYNSYGGPSSSGCTNSVVTPQTGGHLHDMGGASAASPNGTNPAVPAGSFTYWNDLVGPWDRTQWTVRPDLDTQGGVEYDKLVGFFTDTNEHLQLTNGTVPTNKYAYIVVHWNIAGSALNAIKAAHPASKVLAYQNLGGMIAGPHTNSRPTSLVTQEEATAHGTGADDWRLHKESDGTVVVFSDFTYLQAAHIGRASWRTQAQSHFAQIAADGFHGIMLDDVNCKPGHGFNEGEAGDSTEFASNNAYRDAVTGAMAALVGPARDQGLLVVPNVGMDPWSTDEYAGYTTMLAANSLDGVLREFWTNWNGSSVYFDGATWTDTMKVQTDAEAAGKFCVLHNYPLSTPDHTRSIRYGLASFYLHWDGIKASGFGYDDGRPLASFSQYRKLIGTPTGAKTLVSGTATDGAWMRHFTGGVVIANAKSTSGLVTFNLGGTYVDPSGASVTSVQLDTKQGMVLLTPTINDPNFGSGYFWSLQGYLRNAAGSATGNTWYAGLQSRSALSGSPKAAIFSVWGGVGGVVGDIAGSVSQAFSGEGTGWQLLVPYSWTAGRAYTMKMEKDEARGARWFKVYITDTITQVTSWLGSIQAATSDGADVAGVSYQWTELFSQISPATTCPLLPRSTTFFGTPTFSRGYSDILERPLASNTATSGTASVNQLSVSPTGMQADDWLIFEVISVGGSTTHGNIAGGAVRVHSDFGQANTTTISTWKKKVTSTATVTYTFQLDTGDNLRMAIAVRGYTGGDPIDIVEQAPPATGTSAQGHGVTGVTPQNLGRLHLILGGSNSAANDSVNFGPPTDYTEKHDFASAHASNANACLGWFERALPDASVVPAKTFTITGGVNRQLVGASILLKPDTSGSGGGGGGGTQTQLPVMGVWRQREGTWTEDNINGAEAEFGPFAGHIATYKGNTAAGTLSTAELAAVDAGHLIHVYWKVATNWATTVGGTRDAAIDAAADSFKSRPNTEFWFTPWHEPEDDLTSNGGSAGTAAQFRAHWQYVWNRFQAKGVTNVKFVWVIMSSAAHPADLDDLWPGNAYVHGVGVQRYIRCFHNPSDLAVRWLQDLQWFWDNYSPGVRNWRPKKADGTGDIFFAFTEWGSELGGNDWACGTVQNGQEGNRRTNRQEVADAIDGIRGILGDLANWGVKELRYFDAKGTSTGSNWLTPKPGADALAFQALKDATEEAAPGIFNLVVQNVAQPQTISKPTLIIPAVGGNDAMWGKIRTQILNFVTWLGGQKGYIGEFGIPKATDSVAWNALLNRWYGILNQYNLWGTYWATGERWSAGYNLLAYHDSGGSLGVDTTDPPSTIIETHPSSGTSPWTTGYARGINVAGAEFDTDGAFTNANPGTLGVNYFYESQATFDYLFSRGIKVVRLPFRWERIQPTLGAALNTAELTALTDCVNRAGTAGLKVILDVHNYGGYKLSSGPGTGGDKIGSTNVTQAHFTDLWTRLTAAFKANATVVGYGLMNEPNGIPELFTSAALLYSFDSSLGAWHVTSTGTLSIDTTFSHTGAGSMKLVRTWAGSGYDQARMDDAVVTPTDRTANGLSFRTRVFVPTGASGFQARLEIYADGSIHNGPLINLTPNAWTDVAASFPAEWVDSMQSIYIHVQNNNSPGGSISMWFDHLDQGAYLDSDQRWEVLSQAALNAIRTEEGAGAHKTVLVPGNDWSGAQTWTLQHASPWITDSANNFRYEAHHYFDSDNSGDYPDSYTTELNLAISQGYTSVPEPPPPGLPPPVQEPIAWYVPTGAQNPNNHQTSEIYNALTGRTGSRRWSFRYELLTNTHTRIMDLDEVMECTVEHQYLADIKRKATFKIRDHGRINYLSNRIRPWVRLHLEPLGTNDWVEWPLGVFLLASPVRHANEFDVVEREVQGYDPLQYLADDMVATRYSVAAGVNIVNTVATLVAGAAPTWRITRSTETLPAAKEWPPGTSKLVIANNLLAIAEYESVSFDSFGRGILKPYKPPDERAPMWTYAFGPESVIHPGVEQELDLFSVPNKWVAVVSQPDQPLLVASYTNTNPASPTSTVRRGRTIVDFREEEEASSLTVLNNKVKRLGLAASQIYEHLMFETGLMPIHGTNDVMRLVYDPLAISAVYSETSWTIECTAGAPMKHEARRLVSI